MDADTGSLARRPRRLAVAGATGFIGRALVHALKADYEVVGITRSRTLPPGDPPGRPGLRWVTADLFSLLEVERALEGVDAAFYLVHSRLPSAELTQGSVADFDLILADNFGRAARSLGVRHVISLGPIIPEQGPLSHHLRSRLEVETALRACGPPFTAVRASLVIGPASSSFRILENLVRRLPLMLTPRWTLLPSQPIALEDLVVLLRWCLEHPEEAAHRVAEVGGPDLVSFRRLLELTARALGVHRRIYMLPIVTPGLSKLWVSTVSQVPYALVSPLVDSLGHPMVVHDGWLQQRVGLPGKPLALSIQQAVSRVEQQQQQALQRFLPAPRRLPRRDVRSVQRLPLPPGWSAAAVAREYARWLPRFCWPFIHVEVSDEGVYRFYAAGLRLLLLELSYSAARSTPDRQLLYITGGVLSRMAGMGKGRFEFREVLHAQYILAGIHSFAPSLPWRLYKFTQAIVHLWVMRGFGRHLARVRREGRLPEGSLPGSRLQAGEARVGGA